ncbi:hypothetical protein K525DRAFT_360963 [Schizophyllum commune Loenen D]|nr:hypothetical protein K525DRAFT_360963 [Schizophyllum commune Loenen D]
MAPQQPQLGSLAVQAPSLNPKVVHVSKSTCTDISLFKDLLREYRKLDDSINMRLNRATAAARDQARESSGRKAADDQACENIWAELVANWKRRTTLIGYCVFVVDESIDSKRSQISEKQADSAAQRRIKGEMYSDEVLRNQVHNELSVEAIIRKRSLDVFKSRCKYFVPPLTDAQAREYWEGAQR